jgi:hypothetical protein
MSIKGPLKGKIVAILNSRELAINLGTRNGVEIDMVFDIFGKDILKDPDTGENLGTVRTRKGKVKVTTVKEKYSVARTFETYQEGELPNWISASGSYPSIWTRSLITRVKILSYDESGLENRPIDESTIFVRIGDAVEYYFDDEEE